MEKFMWITDWWKKKPKKKAFRIIRLLHSYTTYQPLYLDYSKNYNIVKVQKIIYERVIEKQQRNMQQVKLMPIQHLHFHTLVMQTKICKTMSFLEAKKTKTFIKDEVKRRYQQNILEEQEYFRTRPTLARTTLQRMVLGQPTLLTRNNKRFHPFHLEILKNSVPQVVRTLNKDTIVETPMHMHSISQPLLSTIIQEVKKQLQKDMWRKGGNKGW